MTPQEKRDANGLTEAEAIARYRSKNYPKPALTADIVVLSRTDEDLRILLVERGGHPFMGKMALPGGFANENEPVEETAARELAEETGVSGLDIDLVGIYSQPGRDPRGWIVSAAFISVIDETLLPLQAGDDAAAAGWYRLRESHSGLLLQKGEKEISLDVLAFDHAQIIKDALKKIQR